MPSFTDSMPTNLAKSPLVGFPRVADQRDWKLLEETKGERRFSSSYFIESLPPKRIDEMFRGESPLVVAYWF